MPPPEQGPAAPGPAELLAALPVAVLLIDPGGCVASANAAAEAMLNRSEKLMRDQPLAALLPVVPSRRAEAGHALVLFDVELDAAGQRLHVDVHEASLTDRPDWRVVTLSHAAGSRRLGHAAERVGARAAVGAAAMLAHEIKNPLSGIRGAAQLLAGGEGAAALTGLITTEVDRIAALIDRMQDFTDTRPLPLAAENVYPLLTHARDVARAGFAREMSIEERFDPSLPPALVNRDALLQVLLNLLKNAAEALGNRDLRRITLTTAYRHGPAVSAGPGRPRQPLPIEICVIDTGPGVPDDLVPHLFEPFISGRPEGQGLGLALVAKLIGDMGGLVDYAREGTPPFTVFRVLLPRADA